jgi:hypothetical protein
MTGSSMDINRGRSQHSERAHHDPLIMRGERKVLPAPGFPAQFAALLSMTKVVRMA